MSEFTPVVLLSALDGAGGFRIDGVAAGDQSGRTVASAGDVDGDGFADLVIGARGADPNGTDSGSTYVVFGKAGSFGGALALSALDGADGFRADGEAAGDLSGRWVSSAGDINGDGFADIVTGAFTADPNGSASGSAYVVFGKAGGFAASFDLGDLDGGDGFRIDGEAAGDFCGVVCSKAGDVNGDGIADLIVGANGSDTNGANAGAAYVVFGTGGGFAPVLALSSLDGANGFQLNGEAAGDLAGRRVSAAGDMNGDGIADLVVGADLADPGGADSGAVYVVFGRDTGFAAAFELSALDGANGFKLDGEAAGDQCGLAATGAGDFNGDGIGDLILGAYKSDPNGAESGTAYVVFGRSTGFAAGLDLAALDGTGGFKLVGAAAGDQAGAAAASAGDVNGDGFDDIVVGARGADHGGAYAGSSYVVFGKASGFGAVFALASVDGNSGFRIDGAAAGDRSGFSAASAGDVDGDGFDDLIVGSWGADPNGSQSGSSYVIYGHEALEAVTRTGTKIANTVNGGIGNDTISGLGGNDTLFGRGGNDRINGGSGADTMHGGAGDDTCYADNASDVVLEDPASGADLVIAGLDWTLGSQLEHLTLSGTSANDGTGNGTGNRITGNGAANDLLGLGGNDTLNGAGGGDVLTGGLGRDTMTGGAGADRFVFSAPAEMALGASADRIADFTAGTDTIDFTGLGMSDFIGTDAFTGAAGEVRFAAGGGLTTISGDIDGDSAADFDIRLTGTIALAAGDFIL